ncbi:unnamed protein product, partial [marine sediment metagenome]
ADKEARWSYDGKWIAFKSLRTGKTEAWVVRITSDGKPSHSILSSYNSESVYY